MKRFIAFTMLLAAVAVVSMGCPRTTMSASGLHAPATSLYK